MPIATPPAPAAPRPFDLSTVLEPGCTTVHGATGAGKTYLSYEPLFAGRAHTLTGPLEEHERGPLAGFLSVPPNTCTKQVRQSCGASV